jgi:hypothetical protein
MLPFPMFHSQNALLIPPLQTPRLSSSAFSVNSVLRKTRALIHIDPSISATHQRPQPLSYQPLTHTFHRIGGVGSPDLKFDSPLSPLSPLAARHSPLSPFPATLPDRPQLIENTITLSLVFAALTDTVNHKPFVCHSCKKHRGWGIPSREFSQTTRYPLLTTHSSRPAVHCTAPLPRNLCGAKPHA